MSLILTLNIFSKVPLGQIKKVMNFHFLIHIHLNGLALFLQATSETWIRTLNLGHGPWTLDPDPGPRP